MPIKYLVQGIFFPIYMWPMFANVWTKIQLIMNLNLIKNELKVNWRWTKS
jgi:hypothetical protein